MEKILFITSRLNNDKSGGYLGSKRNLENLNTIYGKEINVFKITSGVLSRIINIVFFKRLELSSVVVEEKIINEIQKEKYNIIFVDNSGLGYLCEKIRKNFPQIKIIVFCHDINYHLFDSILMEYKEEKRSLNNLSRIFKLYFEKRNAKINERKSFVNCDKVITLNKRDTSVLEKIYNYKSDLEIGVTLPIPKFNKCENRNKKLKILFIGTASLKSNVVGIEFFIKEVLQHIDIELQILGKGMEKYKNYFEKISEKVKVIGTVDNLEEYYIEADAVVAPIFSGGGMKVKVAEALSYGKVIFGTKEAFEGYEFEYENTGILCLKSEEFIKNINLYIEYWKKNGCPKYSTNSLKLFKERYSYLASIEKFKKILLSLEEK